MNSHVHYHQHCKLTNKLPQKLPEMANFKVVVFHYHNTRHCSILANRQKLLLLELTAKSAIFTRPSTIRLPFESFFEKRFY